MLRWRHAQRAAAAAPWPPHADSPAAAALPQEKIRPIDKKLHYQIEKLLKVGGRLRTLFQGLRHQLFGCLRAAFQGLRHQLFSFKACASNCWLLEAVAKRWCVYAAAAAGACQRRVWPTS